MKFAILITLFAAACARPFTPRNMEKQMKPFAIPSQEQGLTESGAPAVDLSNVDPRMEALFALSEAIEILKTEMANAQTNCASDYEMYCTKSISNEMESGHEGEQRPERPDALGFGSREADLCVANHYSELSQACQTSIDNIHMTAAVVKSSAQAVKQANQPEDEKSGGCACCILTISLVGFGLIFLVVTRKRRAAVKKIMFALSANPELKAVVEMASGVQVPDMRCCAKRRGLCGKISLVIMASLGMISLIAYIAGAKQVSDVSLTVLFYFIAVKIVFMFLKGVCKCFRFCCCRKNRSCPAQTAANYQPAPNGAVHLGVAVNHV